VVFIHGIPGLWYDWRHQMPALAQHFQVVAIDKRAGAAILVLRGIQVFQALAGELGRYPTQGDFTRWARRA
jgi:hypothetical protein